jgi:hypothetical protein
MRKMILQLYAGIVWSISNWNIVSFVYMLSFYCCLLLYNLMMLIYFPPTFFLFMGYLSIYMWHISSLSGPEKIYITYLFIKLILRETVQWVLLFSGFLWASIKTTHLIIKMQHHICLGLAASFSGIIKIYLKHLRSIYILTSPYQYQ